MGIPASFVFNNAMALMDEFSETTNADGRFIPADDTDDYKARTISILNILAGELYPYSSNFKPSNDGTRPAMKVIDDFDTPIDLDFYITTTVMPYGLAAHLMMQEDRASASFFNDRYEELKRNLSVGMAATSEDIVDVYGGEGYYDEEGVWHNGHNDTLGYKQFSRW